MLLRLARGRGWDCVGLEPSPALAGLARNHGFPVWESFLDQVTPEANGSFDVVAFSDVFEHIGAPLPFLADARRLLKPDGILYVKVPNARWNVFKQRALAALGHRPAQGLWDSYEHVVHYTEPTLRAMLGKAGFDVLALTTARPIQTPNWHEYVGAYYQYPTPWFMDIQRKLVRSTFARLSILERIARGGSWGYFAQSLVAVARSR